MHRAGGRSAVPFQLKVGDLPPNFVCLRRFVCDNAATPNLITLSQGLRPMTFRLSRCLAPVFAGALVLASFSGSVAQEKKPPEPPAVTVIEVYQDKSDEFRFRIKNGDTILAISGKGYEK